MKKYSLLLFIFFSISFGIYAQGTDLARVEYTYIPQSESDNTYTRIRLYANYPIKLNDKGAYMIIGGQYRVNKLDIQDHAVFDNKEDVGNFHTTGLSFGYTFKMNTKWRFGARAGIRISSNLEGSGLHSDDYRYSGTVYFVKSIKATDSIRKSRLILGLRYTTPSGLNFPLPVINYFNKFHTKWSYTIGTPKTNIKHYFSSKNTLQVFAGVDRFYGNIQQNRIFSAADGKVHTAENIAMLTVLGAVGYEYYFTEHLLFYAYTGYTISNQIRLRNGNREEVFLINDKNSIYMRSGLKIKI